MHQLAIDVSVYMTSTESPQLPVHPSGAQPAPIHREEEEEKNKDDGTAVVLAGTGTGTGVELATRCSTEEGEGEAEEGWPHRGEVEFRNVGSATAIMPLF